MGYNEAVAMLESMSRDARIEFARMLWEKATGQRALKDGFIGLMSVSEMAWFIEILKSHVEK